MKKIPLGFIGTGNMGQMRHLRNYATLPNCEVVAKRSDASNVGVLFDPAHFHSTPSKTEHITAETAKWIKHVHVDNMPMSPAETTDCNTARLLPGDPASAYDLVDLFGRFEKFGYKGNYAIEMFNDELWAMPPAAACQKMFAAMQTVFSKLP